MHGVRLCADFCCLYLNFSPNSSCTRQRSHTNQLTALALCNTPRHRRGRRESKQTPITVRHEEGGPSGLGTLCDHVLLALLADKTRGSAELCPQGGYEYWRESFCSLVWRVSILLSLIVLFLFQIRVFPPMSSSVQKHSAPIWTIAAGFLLSGWKHRDKKAAKVLLALIG